MSDRSDNIEDFALPLPITSAARQLAQQFAIGQPTPEKAEQVRLNTLAVCAVKDYLQAIGIPTDLSACDSWNPVTRLCADVADLEVTGAGFLECRPIKASESICRIPREVHELRIGYVVVRIDEALRQASLLGFVPVAAVEELPISQLQAPEELIDRLDSLMQPAPARSAASTAVTLSQWFNRVFAAGWQEVEALLNPGEVSPAFSFRSPDTLSAIAIEPPSANIRRAKAIDLGMQLDAQHSVVLIVELNPASKQKTDILLQVHPSGSQLYLPPGLELIVLDESGATFIEARSRLADNYIQLLLSGSPGERFSVKVALGEASIVEEFVI